ncbi:MAG: SMC-Scp complex subunit ScpB [Patescibacteria group bacterium]
MTLASRIESLLFVAQKPLSIKKLAELCSVDHQAVHTSLDELAEVYTMDARGIVLLRNNDHAEFATHPEHTDTVTAYTKEEVTGELTRAGLETLTVVAYRGPITKSALEQIRGVNCTIVLRNLMMRGLIEQSGEEKGEKRYGVSIDFLRHLGVARAEDLPDYGTLNADEKLECDGIAVV